jgi:hypothetical protein
MAREDDRMKQRRHVFAMDGVGGNLGRLSVEFFVGDYPIRVRVEVENTVAVFYLDDEQVKDLYEDLCNLLQREDRK